jgi:hypothetical protein
VITPGAQGSPAEVVSPTTGLQGLRVERDKLGRFVMLPERLLEIIQSAAAELAASQAAKAMKVLTESGTNHEGKQISFGLVGIFPSQSEDVSRGGRDDVRE